MSFEPSCQVFSGPGQGGEGLEVEDVFVAGCCEVGSSAVREYAQQSLG